MSGQINATLQQQSRVEPPRELSIVDGKEIKVVIGVPPKQKSYAVQLLALADKSQLRLSIAWGWLWLFVIAVVALAAYGFSRSVFDLSLGTFEFSYVAGFTLAAILALVMFILKLTRKRIYVSRLARVKLFEILISNPNPRAYKMFINKIDESLREARKFWNLKQEHQIAGEMRMLRRLSEEGIIRQSEYERAKKYLFSLSSK
ncbi:MAG: hypothetical protein PVG75_02265 [Thioalkalispiraceae bacterium]|jgi:hypothetical protein